MAKKKFLSVGLEMAINHIDHCDFDSDPSLLDWDIIFLKPTIYKFVSFADYYHGKPHLSDSSSVWLKERSEHWRREIKDAVEAGKTIIVFLADLFEVFIDTGRRESSGTGRNRKTTRIVERYDNYRCISEDISPVKTKGSVMKLTPRGTELLAGYWKAFAKYSHHKVALSGENVPALITTEKGNKTVGAIYKNKNSNGALVLVPDIDFYHDDFLEVTDGGQVWTQAAIHFAAQMLKVIVSLDKTLKAEGESTPKKIGQRRQGPGIRRQKVRRWEGGKVGRWEGGKVGS